MENTVHTVVSTISTSILRPLLNLQPQKACFGTAWCRRLIAIFLVESLTAFIQRIYLIRALLFLVRILH